MIPGSMIGYQEKFGSTFNQDKYSCDTFKELQLKELTIKWFGFRHAW